MIDPRIRLIYYLLLDDDEGNSSIAMLRDQEAWVTFRKIVKRKDVDVSFDNFEVTAYIVSMEAAKDLLR